MFQNTGTKYLKRGFTKLAALKDNFTAESDLALAREMFAFSKGLSKETSLHWSTSVSSDTHSNASI